MTLETTLFYLFSLGTIGFALGVVLARSAVYSVLCLVGAMGMMSGLFVLLKAFLVAMVLLLVYAGAILVLFLFVVMMLDYRKITLDWTRSLLSPVAAALLGLLLFWQFFAVVRKVRPFQEGAGILEPAATQGTAENVGGLLFQNYILPFELTAFLILAAVISVVVLAKKESA